MLEWRRAVREWPCALFAFGVPSSEAVDVLVGVGVPFVEMGAGTGYWASLLR